MLVKAFFLRNSDSENVLMNSKKIVRNYKFNDKIVGQINKYEHLNGGIYIQTFSNYNLIRFKLIKIELLIVDSSI